VVDVVDACELQRAADDLELKLGPIDIWVNNAMVTAFMPFDKLIPGEYQRATEVTSGCFSSYWGLLIRPFGLLET
jgi:NAD(P)-dependent dehydrogenase (short-subunit alcohol dehydrogenase family)